MWLEYQVAEQIDSPGDLAPYDALLAAAVAKDPAWARYLRVVSRWHRPTNRGLRVAGCPRLEAALGRMDDSGRE